MMDSPRPSGNGDDTTTVKLSDEPKCWHCDTRFKRGTGYGDEQLFCSETCADSFQVELGA